MPTETATIRQRRTVTAHAARTWLTAFGICVAAVLLCVGYVDRPVADFFEAHFRHTVAWIWLDRIFFVMNGVVLLALLFVLMCGAWTLLGRSLPRWTGTPLLCSWTANLALAAEYIFKRLFGRGWVQPGYITDHQYGFYWLQTGGNWEGCFPSGTATISVAIATVLWTVSPRLRLPGVIVAALLCAIVVVANYHWLGDVVAGVFLGATIGAMTLKLIASESLLP